MHAARVPPLVFSLPPQVRSLRQLDELMRQLVKVVPRAESSALSVPQPATLAAWGCAFSALGCATHSSAWHLGPRVEGCRAAARSGRGRPIPWRSTCQVAHVLGDPALEKRFEACSAAIHRGVPFANSLYV